MIGEVGPARLPRTQRGRRIPVPDDVHKALLFATGRVEEVLAKLRLTDKPLVDAVVGLEDHSEKDERIEAPPQVHFSDEAEPPALLAVAEKVLLADVTEERAIRAMQELNGSDVPRLLQALAEAARTKEARLEWRGSSQYALPESRVALAFASEVLWIFCQGSHLPGCFEARHNVRDAQAELSRWVIPGSKKEMTVKVSELRSEQELMRAYMVVRELHRDLTEEHYAELLAEMRQQGYRLFAAWEDGEIVAVAGVVVLTNLYYECHAFVYDLVTKEEERAGGYGEALMDHVKEFARAAGCATAALACGREREGALRFYERRGYEKPSYAMRKNLQ